GLDRPRVWMPWLLMSSQMYLHRLHMLSELVSHQMQWAHHLLTHFLRLKPHAKWL
ncbi:unnamed protein product, partial [Effrenium voratum]